MKIVNIFDEKEKLDPENYERLNPRRKAMKDFFKIGSKLAVAAVPLGLGSMLNKAYGQAVPAGVIAVLQYALTFEHFEYRFYEKEQHPVNYNGGSNAKRVKRSCARPYLFAIRP